MDIRLNDLTRKMYLDEISVEDAASEIRILIKEKHSLLAYFPRLFGVPFASVYDNLRCYQVALQQPEKEAYAALGEGRPLDKKAVLKQVRLAERWKVKLERDLERAEKNQPSPELRAVLKELNVLDIELLELDLAVSKGKLTAEELITRVYKLLSKPNLTGFPKVFGLDSGNVLVDLGSIDHWLDSASELTTGPGADTVANFDGARIRLQYAQKEKDRLEKELRAAAGCSEGKFMRARASTRACPPPPPPPRRRSCCRTHRARQSARSRTVRGDAPAPPRRSPTTSSSAPQHQAN
jgi:hypothetical protein